MNKGCVEKDQLKSHTEVLREQSAFGIEKLITKITYNYTIVIIYIIAGYLYYLYTSIVARF